MNFFDIHVGHKAGLSDGFASLRTRRQARPISRRRRRRLHRRCPEMRSRVPCASRGKARARGQTSPERSTRTHVRSWSPKRTARDAQRRARTSRSSKARVIIWRFVVSGESWRYLLFIVESSSIGRRPCWARRSRRVASRGAVDRMMASAQPAQTVNRMLGIICRMHKTLAPAIARLPARLRARPAALVTLAAEELSSRNPRCRGRSSAGDALTFDCSAHASGACAHPAAARCIAPVGERWPPRRGGGRRTPARRRARRDAVDDGHSGRFGSFRGCPLSAAHPDVALVWPPIVWSISRGRRRCRRTLPADCMRHGAVRLFGDG